MLFRSLGPENSATWKAFIGTGFLRCPLLLGRVGLLRLVEVGIVRHGVVIHARAAAYMRGAEGSLGSWAGRRKKSEKDDQLSSELTEGKVRDKGKGWRAHSRYIGRVK